MKIKIETFKYSLREYILIHLSEPIPNDYQLKIGETGWSIGRKNLMFTAFLNGKPIPKGLEEAGKLRQIIKGINGIKAVYLEEYEIFIDLSPVLDWEDIEEQVSKEIKTFFKKDEVKIIK